MKLFCPECRASYDDSVAVCPEDGTRLYRLEPADDPLVGAVLDERFRVDWLIGQGGMGAVYRGVQLSVNRQVAIKVLRTEFVDREVALERFFREAKLISGMTHPNIVRLIEFGQDKERDLLYLVMELVDGTSLSDLLKNGRLKASFALEVAYQVCGALTEPHANDIIHRDLKPDNLLLGTRSDGTLETKVLDFGIARALQRNTRLTQTGMICGTPAYMAPEQSRDRKVDARTDLYALGVMLYEMLAGRPPFMAQSSLQIMLKHIQEDPPSLREVLPAGALPEGIESLVYQLIAKAPADRPASARNVRTQIEQIRGEFDLPPVRLDTERSKDAVFADWVMPAMPTSDELERGNTLGLVKETDLFAKTGDDDHSKADTVAENAPTEGISSDSKELLDELPPDTELDQVAPTTPIEHAAGEQVRVAAGAAGVETADDSGAIAQRARAPSAEKRTGESGAVPETTAPQPPEATTRPDESSGISTRTLVSVAVGVAVAVFGLSALLFHLLSDAQNGRGEGAPAVTTGAEATPGESSTTQEGADNAPASAERAEQALGPAHAAIAEAAAQADRAQKAEASDTQSDSGGDRPPANNARPTHTSSDSTGRGSAGGSTDSGAGQKQAGSPSIDSPAEKSESKDVEHPPDAPAKEKPQVDQKAAAKEETPSDVDLEAELKALVDDDE